MKKIRIMMGMPIKIEVADKNAKTASLEKVFTFFDYVDKKFSTYKKNSEIERINRGEVVSSEFSQDMRKIFLLSEKTKRETGGYFEIVRNGKYDPLGLVKGWSIFAASKILAREGYENFYIDAGRDVQTMGRNKDGNPWRVGIQSPFKEREIVKVLTLPNNEGVATSGTYIRGNHIYNPKIKNGETSNILSLTVVGPNIFDADRFATAAFAMGEKGIVFVDRLAGFEGYMINKDGVATLTRGVGKYFKN